MWGVLLIACPPAHSSAKLGHELSLPGGGVVTLVYVTKVVTHMATDVSAWCQPARCGTKLAHEMPLLGGWRAHLTKGQPAQNSTKLGHWMCLPMGYLSSY